MKQKEITKGEKIMERTDKKISAESGKEGKLLDKEHLDKAAGGEWDPDKCPICNSSGLSVTYKQKTTEYGDVIDVCVVNCHWCGYYKEIPQYC